METGVFPIWSVPKSYLEDKWGDPVNSVELPVESHPMKTRTGG
jgi:hypothetical protein